MLNFDKAVVAQFPQILAQGVTGDPHLPFNAFSARPSFHRSGLRVSHTNIRTEIAEKRFCTCAEFRVTEDRDRCHPKSAKAMDLFLFNSNILPFYGRSLPVSLIGRCDGQSVMREVLLFSFQFSAPRVLQTPLTALKPSRSPENTSGSAPKRPAMAGCRCTVHRQHGCRQQGFSVAVINPIHWDALRNLWRTGWKRI